VETGDEEKKSEQKGGRRALVDFFALLLEKTQRRSRLKILVAVCR
jgi:hypothetical protein